MSSDVIGEVMGDFGRWQLRTVLLIYLCKVPSAWFMACLIFTAPIPHHEEFHCNLPRSSIPNDNELIQMIQPRNADQNYHCERFMNNYLEDGFINTSDVIQSESDINIVPCTSFNFNSSFESTITKFELVCSRSILVPLSQFFHLLGVLLGGILATKLLEFISPRKLMLYGMLSQIITGCTAGWVPYYEMHMLFRLLASASCAQMNTAGQMIFTDITGSKYRTMSICLFDTFWSVGVILLPLIAYIDPNYSSIFLMISLPTILLIALWFLIPESPRWLLRKGHIDSAYEVLLNVVSTNETQHNVTSELRQRLCDQAVSNSKEPPPSGWLALWKGPRIVICIIALHIAWAIYVTNFYGLLLNVRVFGREYLSLNTVILGFSELVGIFIAVLLILKTKRKWQYTGALNIFAGLFASIGYFYPDSLSYEESVALLMLTNIIPKITVSCSQAMLFACTSELVAPEKRKILVMSCIIFSRICMLAAPFIGFLMTIHQLLALSAFGALGVVGGLCTFIVITPRTIAKKITATVLPSEYVPGQIFTINNNKYV